MYRRNNRFGWLAMIIAVVALVAIFGGRGRGEFRGFGAPWNAESRWERAERFRDEQAERAERFRTQPDEWRYRGDGVYDYRYRWDGPMLFAPWFVVGKLLKLLLAIGLIAGGLFLLRRDRRPRWRETGSSDDGPGTPLGPIFHA